MRICFYAMYILLSGLTISANVAAQTCENRSPKHTVAVVELFTSEGCSSCPPADRWLQRFSDQGNHFDRIVPLSLHVGYWDYIGWKDPYAQPYFTDRQREYARLRGTRTVYTPQVVLSGKDFPQWDTSKFVKEATQLGQKTAAANVQLNATVHGSQIKVIANAQTVLADPGATTQLHIIVFEMGLRNKVLRGENRGETLTHDYVVRHWQNPKLLQQGKLVSQELIALDTSAAGRNLGVAALVQNAKGEVLQATACIMKN